MAFLCMVMAAGVAMAQPEKSFTFGPKIGVDYTHFWGKNCEHGGQLNYQGGVFFEYVVANRFAIAPEVVFAAQGGKATADVYDDDVDGLIKAKGTFHTNYINVPLMLKFYATPNFSIDFGPQAGFNVYSKMTASGKLANVEAKESIDLKDNTKTVDFGVALGGTYNLTENAFVQARYTLGLTNVFDIPDSHEKNGNVQIAFGMKF